MKRITKFEQGAKETEQRLRLQLALVIDVYPRKLSPSVCLQVGDPEFIYGELERFKQRLSEDGKRGPGRPRKEVADATGAV
jgi:hypothetical protein